MISHDRTAPDRRDADLFLFPLLMLLAAIKFISIFPIQNLIDGIRQSKRCSAWRIQLPVMMLLHNLNIKACRRQNPCGILKKLQQHIHSKRHICRFQNSPPSAGLLHCLKLLLRQSGRTQNHRNLTLHAEFQELIRRLCGSKVNHHIRIHITVPQIRKYRISVLPAVRQINACHNLNILVCLYQAGNDLPHMAVAAMHNCPDH